MEYGARSKTPKVKKGESFFSGTSSTVIIGHGLAGRETAKMLLASKADTSITVIEANDYYESDICGPKSLSSPSLYTKNFSAPQYQLAIEGVEYVTAKVLDITKKEGGDGYSVKTSTGASIPATAVVVCTGFSSGLIKPAVGSLWEDRKKELDEHRKAIAAADNVIIAGGGAVGVDINGEVRGAS
jgi:NADH dehydrogenase FAD-containing subunit